MPETNGDPQVDTIRFLGSAEAFPAVGPVSHIQTHCAHVFLCGDVALKIKRAVRYDYLDQSTLERRHALLNRELELNKPTAAMIYRDVVPVTRAPGGGLELDGVGTPVEWVLRMYRFGEDCEMPTVVASGRLTDPVAEALGRVIHAFHAGCPQRLDPGDDLIRAILDELQRVLSPLETTVGGGLVNAFLDRARLHLARVVPLLRERAGSGHVRRVHGDLHLRNILMIEGQPVLFDALEFDEQLATCDVLYDLAFLLMDLCHRDLVRQANLTMAAYLLAAEGVEDTGLTALPLFMSVRAAIRAMVMLQTDQVTGRSGMSTGEARQYLADACRYLEDTKPTLIAIGGISGTGKTVLARDLAPGVGPRPGAVHLRTDTERKALPGTVDYSQTARHAVYDRMLQRAEVLLAAGRSVTLDGTFLDGTHRAAAESLASRFGIGFCGLWLEAPTSVLVERVTARRGDASDADAAVVKAQLAASRSKPLEPGWVSIDASGTTDVTRAVASAALERAFGTREGNTLGA
jgi:uncharacterized protein